MGGRVLIVDDEDYIRRILCFKLERAGFSTREAASAESAERVIEDDEIDLVLLDVGLATSTNGFDLAARLRADPLTRELPIILLTARGFAADVLRSHEIGAIGYITKPFSTADVVARVRSILGD
ncbi:MAG: response regulator [Thermoanaerobaculales bacterium]|jgi:two-component system phosphate regulon response regulator PhoB|nr:response regulator [Thermoanaerobaculales bacterium]